MIHFFLLQEKLHHLSLLPAERGLQTLSSSCKYGKEKSPVYVPNSFSDYTVHVLTYIDLSAALCKFTWCRWQLLINTGLKSVCVFITN